ncbi:hypothetical protein LCGC14_0220020 [marine sediment metagenome]|uniref:Uncharacterized protein n=1 Tax=marine sediment metagenome TaxID=412755 RepID=A0A0F9UUG1_9ZZZZ
MKLTELVLRTKDGKYVIELWIAGEKSKNERQFDTKKEMLDEIERVISGLRLSSNVCVHKLDNEESPSDKEILDWLDKNMRGYGKGWICRDSSCGRGLRLHETNLPGTKPTVREAIVDAMEKGV